jgi:salicylate hydroxylase
MPHLLQIIIGGGGISGLAAPTGLRRKGHKVTVLERHKGCQTLGGPRYLGPSATRVLVEYGLKDRVE